MSLKKRKKSSLLLRLDGFFTTWMHWWIAVAIVTVIYWVVFTSGQDIALSLYSAVITVWGYMSVRKYGWLDTVVFLAVLPFMFMSAIVTHINARQKEKRELTSFDYSNFTLAATEWVNAAMNEVYEGKVIDVRMTDGRIYVKVETPFGINVPESEVIAGVAKGLHVSPSHVGYDMISECRNYYVFGPEAVWEYTKEKYHLSPIMTFAGIRDRLLCRSSLSVSQQLPRGSSSF